MSASPKALVTLRWNWKRIEGVWTLMLGDKLNHFRIEHNGEAWYNVEEYSPQGNECGGIAGAATIQEAKENVQKVILTEYLNKLISP